MNLPKAIEIVKLHLDPTEWDLYPDDIDAIKLLIEAGKWINANRDDNWHRCNELLPGETED